MSTIRDVAIATFDTETEARMLAELLAGEGIPTVLIALGAAGAYATPVPYPHQLRVRADDEQQARELLDAYSTGPNDSEL